MTISTGLAVVIVLLVVCLVISSTALGLTINSKSNITRERSVQNKPMVSVERDNGGIFAATAISLDGITVNPKDAATKEYVDSKRNPRAVVNDSTSTNGHLAAFKGDTGKIIQDTNLNAADVVKNPATSSTTNAIVTFAGTSGKVIQSETTTVDQLVPYVDATGNVDTDDFTVKCKYQQVPTLGKLSMTTAGPITSNEWVSALGSFDGNLFFPPNSVTNGTTLRISFTFDTKFDGFDDATNLFRLINTVNQAQLAYIQIPLYVGSSFPQVSGVATVELTWRETNDTHGTFVAFIDNISTNGNAFMNCIAATGSWDKSATNNVQLQMRGVGFQLPCTVQVLQATAETIYNS